MALAGRVEEDSAKSAARAEEELGRLIQTASRQQAFINQKFEKLESLFKHAQDESKGQPREECMEKLPLGTVENKDASADVDLVAYTASVDALIASFKSGASPRRRQADLSVSIKHVGSARSPIITSLLPSPLEQARSVSQHRATKCFNTKLEPMRPSRFTLQDLTSQSPGRVKTSLVTSNDTPQPHPWSPKVRAATSTTNAYVIPQGRSAHRPRQAVTLCRVSRNTSIAP